MQKNGSEYMRPSMPFLMHTNCQKRLRNTVIPDGCRRRWKREKMNAEELWGKGWSLRPEQDQRTMECLGTIIRSGTDLHTIKTNREGYV